MESVAGCNGQLVRRYFRRSGLEKKLLREEDARARGSAEKEVAKEKKYVL